MHVKQPYNPCLLLERSLLGAGLRHFVTHDLHVNDLDKNVEKWVSHILSKYQYLWPKREGNVALTKLTRQIKFMSNFIL